MSIFLYHPRFTGKVSSQHHKDCIEVDAIRWGVSRKINSTTATQGDRESANASMTDLTLFRHMDKASPTTFIQPQRHLWTLTTDELTAIFTDQKRMQAIYRWIGISFSAAFLKDMNDEYRKSKNFSRAASKRLPILLIVASLEYANRTSVKQTQDELDKRTGDPQSSSYYQ